MLIVVDLLILKARNVEEGLSGSRKMGEGRWDIEMAGEKGK